MFKLILPINFNNSISQNDVYKLYYSSLPIIKRNIKYLANKRSNTSISSKLLKSKNIMFNDVNNEFLYRDIILFAINNLYIYKDITGHVEYRLRPSKNIFAKNITFDQLLRLLEYGNERIIPTNIFSEAINKSMPYIKTKYDLIYNSKLRL